MLAQTSGLLRLFSCSCVSSTSARVGISAGNGADCPATGSRKRRWRGRRCIGVGHAAKLPVLQFAHRVSCRGSWRRSLVQLPARRLRWIRTARPASSSASRWRILHRVSSARSARPAIPGRIHAVVKRQGFDSQLIAAHRCPVQLKFPPGLDGFQLFRVGRNQYAMRFVALPFCLVSLVHKHRDRQALHGALRKLQMFGDAAGLIGDALGPARGAAGISAGVSGGAGFSRPFSVPAALARCLPVV